MKKATIPCPKCHGTGRVTLTADMEMTLAQVRGFRSATVRQVYDALNEPFIEITAINQRLEDLRRLGFLDRKRQGKCFVYFPMKK